MTRTDAFAFVLLLVVALSELHARVNTPLTERGLEPRRAGREGSARASEIASSPGSGAARHDSRVPRSVSGVHKTGAVDGVQPAQPQPPVPVHPPVECRTEPSSPWGSVRQLPEASL